MIRYKSAVKLWRSVIINVKRKREKDNTRIFSAFLILLTNLKSRKRNEVNASQAFRSANIS
jgi:hypothetical protein